MQKKLQYKILFYEIKCAYCFLDTRLVELVKWSTVQLILKTKHYEKFSFTLVCW